MKPTDTRTTHPVLSFLAIALFFQLVGGFTGWISGPEIDGWYQSLNRSPLNPPGYAFGIVWPALYLLLATSFWAVWKSPACAERSLILRLFAAHMILNWLWSPLFFIGHELFASFTLILVLIFTAAMLLWLIWPLKKYASLIFIPYLAWLTFAGHLSHYIWMHNMG